MISQTDYGCHVRPQYAKIADPVVAHRVTLTNGIQRVMMVPNGIEAECIPLISRFILYAKK